MTSTCEPPACASPASFLELPIDFPGGGRCSRDRRRPIVCAERHQAQPKPIDVDADVKGRDLGSVYADVEAALATVEFPLEYHPELLGEYTERMAAQRKILAFSVLAMIGVFVLLHTSFGSARLATLSFLLLPSALVGAGRLGGRRRLARHCRFRPCSASRRNGILMINQHRAEEGQTWPDLVLRGARSGSRRS
jgi:Cu/Ag efflux pump CusA